MPGRASRRPIHLATGTEMALPMSDQRSEARPACSAGRVQFSGNPWKRSASRMSGVIAWPEGRRMAGGDAIPTVEPFFKVGIASGAHPNPRTPSVQ